MTYNEFSNPEGRDYDINSSIKYDDSLANMNVPNPYVEQLIDLIGILEDISEEELLSNFGITIGEYLNPSEEVINKVRSKMQQEEIHNHR